MIAIYDMVGTVIKTLLQALETQQLHHEQAIKLIREESHQKICNVSQNAK